MTGRTISFGMAAALLLVGCTSGSTDAAAPTTATTIRPAATESTSVSTAAAVPEPSSTAAVITPDSSAPLAPLPDGPCSFSGAIGAGSVTFTVGARLFEFDPASGSISCLSDAGAATGPMRWSPDGTRVLIDPTTVVDAGGDRPSGYFAENQQVTWSAPSGKALIAPAVKDGHLIWRDSHDAAKRLDISFLDTTNVAAYHPAGRAIVAAGTAEDGVAGVYLASNRGQDRRPIATLTDVGSTIKGVGFSMSGDQIIFLHQHADQLHHIHAVHLPDLQLTTIDEIDGDGSQLTISTVEENVVAWQATRTNTTVEIRAAIGASINPGDVVTTVATAPAGDRLQPVGWLSEHRLVYLHQPGGDANVPATLHLWTNSGGTPTDTVIAADVLRSAVRVAHGPFNELPTDIAEQAPG